MTELDPNIILQAGNALKNLPNYGQVIEQRNQILGQQQAIDEHKIAMMREQSAYTQQQAALQRRQTLGTMAAGGDIGGAEKGALGAGDTELAATFHGMGDKQKAEVRTKLEVGASVAFAAKNLPYEQRRAAIQSALPALVNAGWTPEEIAKFDPTDQNTDMFVSSLRTVKDALDQHDKEATLAETHRGNTIKMIGDGLQGGFTPSTDLLRSVTDTPTGGFAVPGGTPSGSVGSGNSVGERNNNPGNIRDGKFAQSQPGYLGVGDGGFAKFAPGAGAAAQEALLRGSYLGRGVNTVDSIINKYAPAGENSAASQANYKRYVANKLGLSSGDIVPIAKIPQLAQAMREFETGHTSGASATASVTNNLFVPIPGGKADKSAAAEGTPQLTPQAIETLAQQIAAGGDMPQLGLGKSGAVLKAKIYNRAAEIQAANGDDGGAMVAIKAGRKANQQALGDLSKRNGVMSAAKNTALSNGNLLVSAAGTGAGTTGSPMLNRWQQAYRNGVEGSPDVAKFGLAINTFANEYAKVVSGATGSAGVAEGARQEMLKHLSEASTPQQVAGIVQQAKLEMASSTDALAKQIKYTQNALRTGGHDAPSARAAPSVGATIRGYRFKGGDPASPSSWAKVR